MSDNYKIIEEKTWERAMHCAVFRNSIEPQFCVTFEADITNFKEKVKQQGLSFTMAMVYAVCKCANEIEEFRYRFLDGKIVLYDRIDTAFTYLNKSTNYSRLLSDRIIFLGEEVSDVSASLIVAQMLYLEASDPGKDIRLYINSPGGSVTAGFAIYDTMQYVKCDVSTICLGLAASFGAFLLAGGAKGKRIALPNAEIMIHQPAIHGNGINGR